MLARDADRSDYQVPECLVLSHCLYPQQRIRGSPVSLAESDWSIRTLSGISYLHLPHVIELRWGIGPLFRISIHRRSQTV